MNKVIIIIIIIVGIILGLLVYHSRKSDCEIILDKQYPGVKPSFIKKACYIFNNEVLVNKLRREKPYKGSIEIYPNMLVNLMDATVIGLGYHKENPKFDYMLYKDIEPVFDKILANQ